MRTIDRYLFMNAVRLVAGLVILALCILLLERSLRIIEIASLSAEPARDATRMALNLIPHYLGLALPAALMIGTIGAVSTLSRSEEVTALLSAGSSLTRVARSFMILAFAMAGLSLVVEGFLQPLARYGYREAVHLAKQENIVSAFRRGEFVTAGGQTSFARQTGEGGRIDDVFVHQRGSDGDTRVVTAPAGILRINEETKLTELLLAEGASVNVMPDWSHAGQLTFERLALGISDDVTPFRRRGEDDRELTLAELLKSDLRDRLPEDLRDDASAAFHFRVGRAVILLFFPLIAIPLGIVSNRSNQGGGIAVGLLLLVVVQKFFEAGLGAAASGAIPAWAGSWPVVAVVGAGSIFLFCRTAYTQSPPPMEVLARGLPMPDFSALPFLKRVREQR